MCPIHRPATEAPSADGPQDARGPAAPCPKSAVHAATMLTVPLLGRGLFSFTDGEAEAQRIDSVITELKTARAEV